MTAQVATAAPDSRRRFRRRHLWLIPGLAVAVYANSIATQHDLGLVPLLLFGILPHLAVLVGIGQPHAHRQLAPRAVPFFNAMHHPATPFVLLGIAATGVLPPFWLVGALAWFSHVIVDWAFGDGLRSADGYRLVGVGRLIGLGPQPLPAARSGG